MENNKDNCPACGGKTENKCCCCEKHKERSPKEYKDLLNRLKRIEGHCNGAVLAMYGLVLLLVPAGSISQELKTTALAVSLATLAMGNVAFLLYDRALHNLLQVYQLVWRPKLHKMLGKR